MAESVNNLSMEEYAIIGASLRYLYEDRYRCLDEDKYLYAGKFNEKRFTEHRAKCERVIKDPQFFHEFGDVRFKRCLCNFYDPQVVTLIAMANGLEKTGAIPSHFGINKISSKLNQALGLIRAYQQEKQQLDHERAIAKVKNAR